MRDSEPRERNEIFDHISHIVADAGREHAPRFLEPVGVEDTQGKRVELLAEGQRPGAGREVRGMQRQLPGGAPVRARMARDMCAWSAKPAAAATAANDWPLSVIILKAWRARAARRNAAGVTPKTLRKPRETLDGARARFRAHSSRRQAGSPSRSSARISGQS